MNIPNYLPMIYEDNLEMQSIAHSEDKEFNEHLKADIDQAFKNTSVLDANEEGISKFEKLFSITPDESTETLQFRKERILNRLSTQAPFTIKYLEQKLDTIIGENNWSYSINYNSYTLDIYITMPGRGWLSELNNLFNDIIPCNIDWTINIYAATWQAVKEHFTTWQDVMDTCDTWQDVMDGEWLL